MDLIKTGQKLTLFLIKNSNTVEISCFIENVYDDRIDLELPQYFMRYIDLLQEGSEMTAKIFTKLGTIDFNTIVISSPLEETFTIELDYNSVKLTSSNEFPSVKILESLEITRGDETLVVTTLEISAECVKFNSDIPFNLEDSVEGIMNLGSDYGIINFKAAISEIDAVFDNEYTAKFLTMSEEDRQTLLYYMYCMDLD